MAAVVIAWVGRNAALQADVPVDWFAAGVAPPAGWRVVAEFRYRADPGDPWGAPAKQIHAPPVYSASYDPPADGWVQVTLYSVEGDLTSEQSLVYEVYVVGGAVVSPGPRITDSGDRRITDAGDVRVTE